MRMNTPSNDDHPHSHVPTPQTSIAAKASFAADLTVIGSDCGIFKISHERIEFRNHEGKIPLGVRHRELRVAS